MRCGHEKKWRRWKEHGAIAVPLTREVRVADVHHIPRLPLLHQSAIRCSRRESPSPSTPLLLLNFKNERRKLYNKGQTLGLGCDGVPSSCQRNNNKHSTPPTSRIADGCLPVWTPHLLEPRLQNSSWALGWRGKRGRHCREHTLLTSLAGVASEEAGSTLPHHLG